MIVSELRRLSSGRLAGLGFFSVLFWLLPAASAQPATRRPLTPFAAQFGNGCQTQVLCAAIERLGLYAGLRLDGTATDAGTERELALGGTVSLGLDLIRRVALEASFPVGLSYRGAESTLFVSGPLRLGGRLRLGGAAPTLFSERPQPRLAWVLGAYVTLPVPNAAGDERHAAVLGVPQPEIQAAAEIRWGPVQLVPSLGALVAEQAVYLLAGGRVSLSLSQSLRFDLEAQSRIPLSHPDEARCGGGARVGLGLRGLLGKGVMGAAHYDHGSGNCEAAHRIILGLTFALGEQPLRPMVTPEEAGVERAWLGRVDPVLDCNGWMLDEATLLPEFKFGDPDPQDPQLIRRGEEVFRVGEHFDLDRSGRLYRPHQYVALAGEHAFTEATTADKLALPVCEFGPKHRYFEHCQFFAKSLEKLAEAVQALDEGHGAIAAQVRELQYEEQCVSPRERQDPREMFLGLLKGLRGRARTSVRPPSPPPPPPPIRRAPGDLTRHLAPVSTEVVADAAKAGKKATQESHPDFVVTPSGTSVPVSQQRMRDGFERAGFAKKPVIKDELGQVHEVPTSHGLTDVRTMEGSEHHPKRAVFTRANTNDPVKIDGERWKGNVSQSARRAHGHLQQKD